MELVLCSVHGPVRTFRCAVRPGRHRPAGVPDGPAHPQVVVGRLRRVSAVRHRLDVRQ